MSKRGHFWFSATMRAQKAARDVISFPRHPPLRNYARLDSGAVVEFTLWTNEPAQSACVHKDLVYLGEGAYERSETH